MDEVEKRPIKEYRLMIFTIFNDAILHSFNPKDFQFQTDDEWVDDFKEQIQEAIKQGYSL